MKQISLSILIIMLFIISFSSAYSQGKRLGRFDLEFDAGMTIPVTPSYISPYYDFDNGITLKLEGRYNLKKIPINAGIQIDFSRFNLHHKDFDRTKYLNSTDNIKVMMVADYSFRRGKKINPYAGVGLARNVYNGYYFKHSDSFGIVTTRAGVRFFDRLNMAIDYQINAIEIRHMSIYAGYYF